jgi:HSP20 family protein
MVYQECHWGKFSRSIILPLDVVNERIDATLKDGLLSIRLPKAHPKRSIKVKPA